MSRMSRVKLQSYPQTPLRESLPKLMKLVSPYTGIVKEIYEVLPSVDDARSFYLAAEAASSEDILGATCNKTNGGGHYDREVALAAAIAETAERYSGVYLPESRFLLATARELELLAVEPVQFCLYSDSQYSDSTFPFVPFTNETKVYWVEGFSLPDGKRAYLPAQLVYLWYGYTGGEPRIGYTTSNGLACGATLEEAILSALLEAVERDAFMITWLSKLSLPVIDLNLDEDIIGGEIKRQLNPAGLQHSVIDLSLFWGIPTALGVVRNTCSDVASLAVGAASAPDIRSAVSKALLEAYHTRSWARMVHLANPHKCFRSDFSDINAFDDHILFYAKRENVRHADFLDASTGKIEFQDIAPLEGRTPLDYITAIAHRLKAHGFTAYAVDVTSPDIRQAGFHVVKVVCPELCPLNAAYRLRFLGGKRLYDAAYQLGLRSSPLSSEEINPYPHPFP